MNKKIIIKWRVIKTFRVQMKSKCHTTKWYKTRQKKRIRDHRLAHSHCHSPQNFSLDFAPSLKLHLQPNTIKKKKKTILPRNRNHKKIKSRLIVFSFWLSICRRFDTTTMSSGGPTTTSSNTSPRVAAGPTTTRRRVADINNNSNNNVDTEKQQVSSSFSDFSELEQDDVVSGTTTHHHAHIHHHLNPITRYLLLRARILFCVPESFIIRLEQLFIWLYGSVQSLRSGKNVGRKIFAVLILMVVMSVFVKVSFIGGGVEMNGKSIENGQLILQRFKEDWASAQRVVTETETQTETSMPKRVLERLAVSDFFLLFPLFLNPIITFRQKCFFFLLFYFYLSLKSSLFVIVVWFF